MQVAIAIEAPCKEQCQLVLGYWQHARSHAHAFGISGVQLSDGRVKCGAITDRLANSSVGVGDC